ncbi:hypothetical protein AnigIFM50267_007020 [Aspergillus niger]|nr:hypothetical protein AnigIFM50267_007020 [Aspergillus niger]
MAQGSSRRLEELPVELLEAILAAAPDITTLEAAAMTGPGLYNAFKGAEQFIVRPVVLRQFDPSLIHDVLATHASNKIDHQSTEQVETFMVPYLARDQHYFEASMNWRLSEALLIDRLDEAVKYLVDQLAAEALPVPSTSDSQNLSSFLPPSKTERNRISRSLYRFHANCNLQQEWDAIAARSAGFAPWENEQLYCIYDFLMRMVKQGLIITKSESQSVIEDPNLRSNWPQYISQVSDTAFHNYLQFHLSLGLTHVRRFALQNEKQLQQIVHVTRATPRIDQQLSFLYNGLHPVSRWPPLEHALGDFDAEDEKKYIPQPWYHDPDSGPEDIWRWAHRDEEAGGFVGNFDQAVLRQWAYVMWDRGRIDGWFVFIRPWVSTSRRYLERLGQDSDELLSDGLEPEMRERLLLRHRRIGLNLYDPETWACRVRTITGVS